MNNIPFADIEFICWQAKDKGFEWKNHSDPEFLVTWHHIDPHLLYSGEYVASAAGLSGGYVNYFDYIKSFRKVDPHPLISLQYLFAFGCDTTNLDIFSILRKRPHLFGCLSPLVSAIFCDVGDSHSPASEEYEIPQNLYAYLLSGHMRNLPIGFGASLLVPNHFYMQPFRSPYGISEVIPNNEGASESPKVSILVPLYNTKDHHLRALVSSLYTQTSSAWQLILYDDGSQEKDHIEYVSEIVSKEPRIRFIKSWVNRGISEATNRALRFCSGEFVLFVDHDDMLHPNCLAELVHKAESTNADIVYADHILISENDQCIRAFKKYEWDPILFMQVMYICHPFFVRSSILGDISLDSSYNRIQDYEFALRLSLKAVNISYAPVPLYYWRATPGSFAAASSAKGDISELHQAAVSKHIHRLQLADSIYAAPNKGFPHRISILPNPDMEVKVSSCISYMVSTRYMQSSPNFLLFLRHLEGLCRERCQELFCVNNEQFLIVRYSDTFLSVAVPDLVKWHCIPDVVITSFSQISPERLFIAHGHQMDHTCVKPLLSGLSCDQDDGTGIPISDRCVPVCNPTHLCINADFFYESFLLIERFSNPSSLDFDTICILLSLCASASSKRNVSLVSDLQDDIRSRAPYQVPSESIPWFTCFREYLLDCPLP